MRSSAVRMIHPCFPPALSHSGVGVFAEIVVVALDSPACRAQSSGHDSATETAVNRSLQHFFVFRRAFIRKVNCALVSLSSAQSVDANSPLNRNPKCVIMGIHEDDD